MRLSRLTPFLVLPAFALGTALCSAAPVSTVIAHVPRDAGLRDLGRLPAGSHLSLAVSLPYQHPQELEQLVQSQADAASPLHHRFLSKEQFDSYFAPSFANYERARAALRAAGFTVTRSYPNRTLIDVSAGTPTVERFFDTEIHRFAQSGYGVRYANVREARIPAALNGLLAGVVGLNNVGRYHAFHQRAQQPLVAPHLAVPGKLFGPNYGYGPAAFIDGYAMPTRMATGKGQASAIVIDADFLDSDLAAYLQYFGIYRSGPPTIRVPVDGGPPAGLTADSIETAIDTEALVGIAPGTSLYVYEFPSFANDQYILDAYEQVVVDDYVGTVNSSFGGCELADTNLSVMSDQLAQQGAALGITFHASSGDSGAFTCGGVGVSSPASAPHFVAVGGTSLYLDPASGKELHEFAWSGSGGGTSVIFPTPFYQKGLAGVIPTGRNVPDLSFDADPGSGADIYINGGFVGVYGGTSLSSPIFGGAQTLLNQIAGGESGFVNPAYYNTFKKHGDHVGNVQLFRDITFGNNGYYTARPGFDQVTGIGAPIVGDLHHFVR